jgi:hypothetical protein
MPPSRRASRLVAAHNLNGLTKTGLMYYELESGEQIDLLVWKS